jgi:hypothetical protein
LPNSFLYKNEMKACLVFLIKLYNWPTISWTRRTPRTLLQELLVKLYYLYLLISLNKYHNTC